MISRSVSREESLKWRKIPMLGSRKVGEFYVVFVFCQIGAGQVTILGRCEIDVGLFCDVPITRNRREVPNRLSQWSSRPQIHRDGAIKYQAACAASAPPLPPPPEFDTKQTGQATRQRLDPSQGKREGGGVTDTFLPETRGRLVLWRRGTLRSGFQATQILLLKSG